MRPRDRWPLLLMTAFTTAGILGSHLLLLGAAAVAAPVAAIDIIEHLHHRRGGHR